MKKNATLFFKYCKKHVIGQAKKISKPLIDISDRYPQNASMGEIDLPISMNENSHLGNQPPEPNHLRAGMPGILGDLKYFLNIRKIIKSNRSFFLDFYFRNHFPETLRSLTATGEWMKKLECINDALATKNNLLESIEQAIALAQESIKFPFVRKLAVQALQQELARYAAVDVVAASCR